MTVCKDKYGDFCKLVGEQHTRNGYIVLCKHHSGKKDEYMEKQEYWWVL